MGTPGRAHRSERQNSPRRRAARLSTIGGHLVALVLVQLILVGTLVAFAARRDFRTARADTEARTAAAVKLASAFVTTELESNATSLAQLPAVLDSISTEQLCDLAAPTEEDTDPRWFHGPAHVLFPDGSAACPSDDADTNVAGESWFRSALASSEPISAGPLIDQMTGKRAMMYALSIPDRFVLAYSVELDSVGPALDNQFGGSRAPVRFTIIGPHRRSEIASSGAHTGRLVATSSGFRGPLARERNTFDDLDGVERIYSAATIADLGWHIYAGVSTADAFADASAALRERIAFAVIIAALVFAAALVVQRRFARPVRSLLSATKRFRDGDNTAAVALHGPAELSELGEGFNDMMRVRGEAEEALASAYRAEQRVADELREVDGMRNAFLMAISHELRTPLTAVVGFASILDSDWDAFSDHDARRAISSIASQSKRLERLLLDLLDVERLSRGTIDPNLQETEVGALVERVVKYCSKDRVVDVSVDPVNAVIDPALMERIVENLVRNAVKHTPPDSPIWVKAWTDTDDLHVVVEDAGPGIPDALKPTIFDPFVQGDVPEHSPGTGVGLTLVAQFTKLHGGRVEVTDRVGGGARFDVVVPRRGRDVDELPVGDRELTAVA